MTPSERIQFEFDRAEKDGDCILATCYLMPNGYASIGVNYRKTLLHRLVLEHKIGRQLLPHEVSRHRCHVRRCINPDHLTYGSPADNIRDKDAAGHTLRGENIAQARLSADDVRAIRSRYSAGGVVQRVLAAEYGVSQASVALIVNRKNWKHIA